MSKELTRDTLLSLTTSFIENNSEGFETDNIENYVDSVLTEHNDTISGLQSKRDELLGEAKKAKSDLSKFKTDYEDLKNKFEPYEKIEDPAAALDAIEKVKAGKVEGLEDLNTEVEKRTRALHEELARFKSENEQLTRDLDETKNNHKVEIREQKFNGEIDRVASSLKVEPSAYDAYKFYIQQAFKWDEDAEEYRAYHTDGTTVFGKRSQTTTPANIELYTKDWLFDEKPFLKSEWKNVGLYGNTGDKEVEDEFFEMVSGKPRMTSKGLQWAGQDDVTESDIEERENRFVKRHSSKSQKSG